MRKQDIEIDTTISDYEKMVEECAANEENLNIPNATFKHAYIGIKHLLFKAKKHVRIVSGRFNGKFWDNLCEEFITFLDKPGTTLDVIVLNSYDENGLLQWLKASYNDKVKVFKIKKENQKDTIPHFLTIDSKGYRFETADEREEEKIVEGIMNYGDKEGTSKLNTFFEAAKRKSNELLCGVL